MVAATTGAVVKCTCGATPSVLKGINSPTTLISGMPACTIMDGAPLVNLGPFGLCSSMANPAVAAATTAAMGVLTPQPCTPMTAAWIPTQVKVLVGGKPCLTLGSVCICKYLGVINILSPGQLMVQVG